MSELAKALLAFQKDPPQIALDGTNPHFHSKFASLGGVVSAIRPALSKHGLVVTQLPQPDALETRLIHAESGEAISSFMPLHPDRDGPQAQGSALTYARRYSLLAILGLVGDDDDDANAAQSVQARQNGDAAASTDPHGLQTSRADAVPADQIVFSFGKHKGTKVTEVPRNYLEWWLTSDSAKADKNQELRAAVELHLGLAPVIAAGASDLDDIPFGPSIA